jgi:hypothetical protein
VLKLRWEPSSTSNSEGVRERAPKAERRCAIAVAASVGLVGEVKQNIDASGRAARGGISVMFLLAAGVLAQQSRGLAIIFLVIGLFCLFEALRGWCAVRACGFRTPF